MFFVCRGARREDSLLHAAECKMQSQEKIINYFLIYKQLILYFMKTINA